MKLKNKRVICAHLCKFTINLVKAYSKFDINYSAVH